MKKKLNIFILVIVLLLLTSCTLLPIPSNGNDNTNNVTNNITNTVVEYKEMSVEDFQTAIEVAVDRVENAVIGIKTTQKTSSFPLPSENQVSIGSGVIYKRVANLYNPALGETSGNIKDYTYYVITNRHVVEGEGFNLSTTYTVYIENEDDNEPVELPATLLGYDTKVDVALVKFNHTKYINPVVFGDSDEVKKGSFAIAVGNPDGFDYYGSVTFGVISSPSRYLADDTDNDGTNDFDANYIQHDVAINPGNSGGGLFDIYGHLIGINTLKLVDSSIDNMGFAIPSNVIYTIVTEYLEKGKPIVRPRLGVLGTEVRNLTEEIIQKEGLQPIPTHIYEEQGVSPYGLYIMDVTAGGTIANSIIEAHDIILTFDDIKITRSHLLTSRLNSLIDYHVGSQVAITFYDRSSDSVKTTTVTLKA